MTAVLEPLTDEIVGFDGSAEPTEFTSATTPPTPATRRVFSGRSLRVAPVAPVAHSNGQAFVDVPRWLADVSVEFTNFAEQIARATRTAAPALRRLRDEFESIDAETRAATLPSRRVNYAAAVETGVEFLDAEFGRDVWLSRVDVERLDLASPFRCVLAQVTGLPFASALSSLGKDSTPFEGIRWSQYHGFVALSIDAYDLLQNAWESTLSELKSTVTA